MTEKKAERILDKNDPLKKNHRIMDPDVSQKVAHMNKVIAACLHEINILENGGEPEPKTIIMSDHYANGSQTMCYSNASVNHMKNIVQSIMGSLPADAQMAICFEQMNEAMGKKQAAGL